MLGQESSTRLLVARSSGAVMGVSLTSMQRAQCHMWQSIYRLKANKLKHGIRDPWFHEHLQVGDADHQAMRITFLYSTEKALPENIYVLWV